MKCKILLSYDICKIILGGVQSLLFEWKFALL